MKNQFHEKNFLLKMNILINFQKEEEERRKKEEEERRKREEEEEKKRVGSLNQTK